MTRQQYINKTMKAICGTEPANPPTYHMVCAMADRLEGTFQFDKE